MHGSLRHLPPPALTQFSLQQLGAVEDRDVRAVAALVEPRPLARELGQLAQRDLDLHVGAAVVDRLDALEVVGAAGALSSIRRRKVEVGSRFETTLRAVMRSPSTQLDADRAAVLDQDPLHRLVDADLAAALLDLAREALRERADAALQLVHHPAVLGRREREHEAGGAAGRVGPAEGRVDREEREHGAQDLVPGRVGEEPIDDVHHAAEEAQPQRVALLDALRRVEDLAEAARRAARIEAVERARGPLHEHRELREALGGVGAVVLGEVLQHPHRVRVHVQRRLARDRRCWSP